MHKLQMFCSFCQKNNHLSKECWFKGDNLTYIEKESSQDTLKRVYKYPLKRNEDLRNILKKKLKPAAIEFIQTKRTSTFNRTKPEIITIEDRTNSKKTDIFYKCSKGAEEKTFTNIGSQTAF